MYLFQGLTVKIFLLLGNLDPDLERDLVLVRWPMLYKLFSVLLLLLYTLRVVDREEDHSFLLGNILDVPVLHEPKFAPTVCVHEPQQISKSWNWIDQKNWISNPWIPKFAELGSFDLSTTHNLGYQILQGEIEPI
jgi:hypothetical protein